MLSIFVPFGPDESGQSFVPLNQIVPCFTPDILPEIYIEGNPLTIVQGDDDVSILSGTDIQEGDYLVVRGKSYEVYAKTDDDCFTFSYGVKNRIRIKGTFKNNVKRQRFRYRKMPKLSGVLANVNAQFLKPHNPVDVKFSLNKNGNNHGLAEVSFFNIIFNEAGFMTQDRAIIIAQ